MRKISGRSVFLGTLILVWLGLIEWLHFAVPHEPHGGVWNAVPGWDLAFGLLGGLLLFGFGAWILKPLLTRSEDYYREGGER